MSIILIIKRYALFEMRIPATRGHLGTRTDTIQKSCIDGVGGIGKVNRIAMGKTKKILHLHRLG